MSGTHDTSLSSPWTVFEGGVNVVGGNLSFAQTDLTVPSIGFPTTIARAYNSALAEADGPFGHGWSWSLGHHVAAVPGGVEVVGGDGRNDHYVAGGSGAYTSPAGVYDTLTDLPGGGWLLVRQDQVRLAFTATGALASVGDPNGNTLYLSYINGNLASARDPAQRTWSFDASGAGRIVAVHDPSGRATAYGYSAAGDLISVVDASGARSTFGYANHRLTTITDPDNHIMSYAYDGQERVARTTSPIGTATTFQFNESNRHTTVTDARTNVHSYDYDVANRVIRLTDALSHTETWTWDASNNRTGVTDRNGGATTYGYDGRGNVISVTDAEGGRSSAVFDAQNHPTSRTDALGRVTMLTYDVHGNPAEVTDPAGRVTTFAYDLLGQLVASNDGNGNTTSFGHDSAGNRTTTTNALGAVTRSEYDTAGRVTAEVDADGRTTRRTYDAMGRILGTTDGAGGTTASTYDAAGNRKAVTDQRNNVTHLTYDAANRLTRSVDALGGSMDVSYDGNGNRTSVSDPLGHVTTLRYDAANRVTETTDPNGHTTSVGYDAAGNRTRTTDALGRTTTFRYDRLNRLIGVDDAAGGHATYAYDAIGNRVTTTDPNGNTARTAFDALDRPVSETDPLSHASTVRYDAIGNVVSRTDANGVTTHLTYDAANRMVRADYSEGAVTFAYDRAGNRVGVTDQGGTTTFTYDGLSRLTSNASDSGTISYEYDPAGNLTVLANPDGTTVRHTYDALNREIGVIDSADLASEVDYDAAGHKLAEDRPNGTHAAYAYDAGGQIRSIDWTGPDGGVVARFAYTYDAVGNKTRVVDTTGTSNFAYDPLDRLTSAAYPNDGTVTYAYDPAGNRTAMNVNGVTTNYAYNAANQQTSAGANAVTWDANGNMLTNGPTTYRHDSQNRLIGVDRGSLVEQFSYNGADHRTSQGVNGVVTRYGYDVHRDLAHVVTETSPANAHVYGLGDQALWDTSTDQGRTYYHEDAMGSTAALTRADGSALGTRTYDAFGAPPGSQVGTGSYWFNGEQYDPNSGLIYLRARYYDPASGRFLEPDPAAPDLASPQTLNKYAYAMSNPFRYSDPSGRYFESYESQQALAIAIGVVLVAAILVFGWEAVALAPVALIAGSGTAYNSIAARVQLSGIDLTGTLMAGAECALPGVPNNPCSAGVYAIQSIAPAFDSEANVDCLPNCGAGVYDPLSTSRRGRPSPSSARPSQAPSKARASTYSGRNVASGDARTLATRSSSANGSSSQPRFVGSFGGSNWSASFISSGIAIPLGGAYIPLGYNPAAGVGGGNAAGGARFCTESNVHGYCVVLGIGGYPNLTEYHLDRNIVSVEDTGFHLTLWDQQNLSGTPTHMDSSDNLPPGRENTTRSIRVERIGDTTCNPGSNGVTLYRDSDHATGGGCIFTQSSIPDLRPSTFDEAITSLRFVGSAVGTKRVLFFRRPNYEDLCGSFTQNWSDLQACARVAISVQVLDYTPPPPIPVPPGTFYAGNTAPYATPRSRRQ